MFFYVSDILRQVIENGGSVGRARRNRKEFSITDDELSKYEYSDEPISITHVVRRINNLIDASITKKLSYKVVSNWLLEIGLLEPSNGRYPNSRTCPTQMGNDMGITIEKRANRRGEYYAVYYNRNAQEFIINHIQSIT